MQRSSSQQRLRRHFSSPSNRIASGRRASHGLPELRALSESDLSLSSSSNSANRESHRIGPPPAPTSAAAKNTHCVHGCFPRCAAEAAKVASARLEALGAAASGTVCASARSRARQACARARHQGSSRCAATRAIISAQTMAQGGEIEIKWVGEASTATKGRAQFRKAKALFQEGQVEEASWRDRRYFMIIILVTLSNWPRLSRRIHRLHCLEELQSRPLSDVHLLQVLVRQHAKCFHIHLLLRSKASGCP